MVSDIETADAVGQQALLALLGSAPHAALTVEELARRIGRRRTWVVRPAGRARTGRPRRASRSRAMARSEHGGPRSAAQFAAANGTAPVPASSGQVDPHRLNRGGNRRLNRALHTVALVRSVGRAVHRSRVQTADREDIV